MRTMVFVIKKKKESFRISLAMENIKPTVYSFLLCFPMLTWQNKLSERSLFNLFKLLNESHGAEKQAFFFFYHEALLI